MKRNKLNKIYLKTCLNKQSKSAVKTYIRNFLLYMKQGVSYDYLFQYFNLVKSKIMIASKHNIFKKNNAARKVSRLSILLRKYH